MELQIRGLSKVSKALPAQIENLRPQMTEMSFEMKGILTVSPSLATRIGQTENRVAELIRSRYYVRGVFHP